jgi:hypothetical protein
MQLWEILVADCPNVVSALGKKLQQYRNSSSSIGASGIQTDGALPSHDSRLVSFNVIVGTVNTASSFTRFFWGPSDCVWLVCRRSKLATLPAVLGIKLCSWGADFVWSCTASCFAGVWSETLVWIVSNTEQSNSQSTVSKKWLMYSSQNLKTLKYCASDFIGTGWNICVCVTVYWCLCCGGRTVINGSVWTVFTVHCKWRHDYKTRLVQYYGITDSY